MILTDDGAIYGCGLASSGQLGIVEESLADREPPCSMLYAEFTPVPLESASGIIQIVCGDDYSLALSQGGNVYSTGSGAFGIHGQGANADELNDRYKFSPIGQSIAGFFKT